MGILFISNDICFEHDPSGNHPERPDRLSAVLDGLERAQMGSTVTKLRAEAVEENLVLQVHDQELISQLNIPSGMSVIARTAGIGRTAEEMDWDLNYLVQLWNAISSASDEQAGSFLIYQESSLVIRSIRDHFHQDIGELLIDTDEITDEGPGIENIFNSFSMHSLTRIDPGSDIHGVPASDIIDTILLLSIRLITFFKLFFSLNL